MTETDNRKDSIIILRAIAIILVIIGHTLTRYRADFSMSLSVRPFVDIIISLIYAVHIPLFFTISGYLNHSQPYRNYLWKKVLRILVPFVVFSLLKLIFSNFISAQYAHGDSLLSHLKQAFLYGELYWFCYAAFLIFAAAPLLWKKDGNGIAPFGIAFAVICALSVTFLPMFGISIPTVFQFNNAVFYFPFFALGYCLRHSNFSLNFKRPAVTILLCIVSLSLIILFLFLSDINIDYETFFPVKFLAAISLMFLIFLCVRHLTPGRFISTVSAFSLQIMFFDSFFKIFLLSLFSKLGLTGVWICIPVVVTNLLLCILCCRIAEKFKITRKLTGLP